MMHRPFFVIFAVLALLAFPDGGKAQTKKISALLKISPEVRLSGSFAYPGPETEIVLFGDQKRLAAFLASTKCVSSKRRPLCEVLDTMPISRVSRCVAVFLDTKRPRVTKSLFRVGIGGDEKDARIKAFFGSKSYDTLYFEQRLINPFRTAEQIDEHLFENDDGWKEAIVASKCY